MMVPDAGLFWRRCFIILLRADHMNYPPDGVHNWKVRSTDLKGCLQDGYTDRSCGMMKQQPKTDPIFLLPEADWSGPWHPLSECSGYVISAPSDEFMASARKFKGSPMSFLAQLLAQSVERIHPENSKEVAVWIPVSVRKAMGTENSLLNQVIHGTYRFKAEDLTDDGKNTELNAAFRTYLKGFATEQNVG